MKRRGCLSQYRDWSAVNALLNHCRVYLCGNMVVDESVCLAFLYGYIMYWCAATWSSLTSLSEPRWELSLDVNILRFPESDHSVPRRFDANPAHFHLEGSPVKDLLKCVSTAIRGSAGVHAPTRRRAHFTFGSAAFNVWLWVKTTMPKEKLGLSTWGVPLKTEKHFSLQEDQV